jgi:putative membrane protein
MSEPPADPGERFSVRATADSHFSWVRTRLALESTLLAWVRTAASLIGFGFTIVQFFQRFHGMPEVKEPWLPGAPRDLGLALIFAGVVSLALSVFQYVVIGRYLRSGSFAALAVAEGERYQSAGPAVAVLLLVIGLLAFFAVLLRLT